MGIFNCEPNINWGNTRRFEVHPDEYIYFVGGLVVKFFYDAELIILVHKNDIISQNIYYINCDYSGF